MWWTFAVLSFDVSFCVFSDLMAKLVSFKAVFEHFLLYFFNGRKFSRFEVRISGLKNLGEWANFMCCVTLETRCEFSWMLVFDGRTGSVCFSARSWDVSLFTFLNSWCATLKCVNPASEFKNKKILVPTSLKITQAQKIAVGQKMARKDRDSFWRLKSTSISRTWMQIRTQTTRAAPLGTKNKSACNYEHLINSLPETAHAYRRALLKCPHVEFRVTHRVWNALSCNSVYSYRLHHVLIYKVFIFLRLLINTDLYNYFVNENIWTNLIHFLLFDLKIILLY